MKFLPIENIVYSSNLNKDEIIERLVYEMEFKDTFINYVSGKLFDGEITDNKFKITRKINYRNSFLPLITGIIENNTDGSKITVLMKLHKGVTIFFYFWVGFLLLLTITELTNDIYELQPLGMIFLAYLIIMLSFKYESYKSKQLLKDIFKAEIISE